MTKILTTITTFSLLSLLTLTPALASYGPGYTTGWDNSIDGLKGHLNDSFYKHPANFYDRNETINLQLIVENPSNNSASLESLPIYVNVMHVTHSPAATAIDQNNNLSEDTLYSNNGAGDLQTPYASTYVESISLNIGESKTVNYSFSIPDEGYYQVDFSSASSESSFQNGTILGAGFVRVKHTSDDNGGSNPNIVRNRSSHGNPTGEVAGLSTVAYVPGAPTVTPESSPTITPTPTPTETSAVLGTQDTASELPAGCSSNPTLWLLKALFNVLATIAAVAFLNNKKRLTVMSLVILAISAILHIVFPCSCSDVSLCSKLPLLFAASFLLSLFFANKKQK